MSTEPSSAPREESTMLRRSSTIAGILAFACAPATLAIAEDSDFTSSKILKSERMSNVSEFFESTPASKLTALSRSEKESFVLLIDRAYSNPLVTESLEEFEGLDEEAAEMGAEPPDEEVKRMAKRILMELTREFPRYYMVSPGEGRGITIQASAGMGKGRGVLIVCDPDGVACFVTMNGKSRRARYDHSMAEDLPDDFIRTAMRQLGLG